MRKNIFQYDDILNNQRKQLFKARNEILRENIFNELCLRYSETFFDEEISTNLIEELDIQNKYKVEKWFDSYAMFNQNKEEIKKDNKFYKNIWISNDLRISNANLYEKSFLKSTRSTLILSVIDFYWTEHLERMNYIRETINWRSYGQQNPLIEYNNEAYKSFKRMFEEIQRCMLYYSLNNAINY
jgi:preprotein translocase subunit SecA